MSATMHVDNCYTDSVLNLDENVHYFQINVLLQRPAATINQERIRGEYGYCVFTTVQRTRNSKGGLHLKDVNSIMQIWAVFDHISANGSKPGSSLLTNCGHLRVNRGNSQIQAPGHFCRQGQDPRLYSLTEGQFRGCPAQRITAEYSKAG